MFNRQNKKATTSPHIPHILSKSIGIKTPLKPRGDKKKKEETYTFPRVPDRAGDSVAPDGNTPKKKKKKVVPRGDPGL